MRAVPDARDPTGLAATAAPGVDATGETVARGVDATGETVARAADTTDPGATTARVGDDLRAVTVDRFGEVERERFEVIGELARGGLGRVLRARDPRTGRVVALKEVLRPTRDLVVRFAREAIVTANLQHPSIVPVYEVGRWRGGEPFYAMKLVRGRALDALIDEARTTAARVALVPHVIDVADALAYAHSEHVIHRDLKPANVLVGPYGETVVIDWGIARNLVTDHGPDPVPTVPPRRTLPPGQTVAGTVIGTPAYMPPEQAAGKLLDERADVYAIGALLYHVLSGVRPYAEHRMVDQILDAVEAGPPRALAELAPDAPAELVAIAQKAMARVPADRYASAEGLAEDLRRYQAGQLVGAHRYSTRERLRRWVARHRGAVLTAAVAAIALAVFGVVSVRRIAAERDEARRQRADAQASRALAERRFADSLAELGRQAALAGAPDRALPFLIGAASAQPTPPPALALMLGQARAAFHGLTAIAPAPATGTTVTADLADGGRLLITASTGRELRAWDVATQRVAWEAAGVYRVVVSADGTRLLAAGDGGVITVRAAVDGAVQETWTAALPEGDGFTAAAWAADGERFALGSSSGRVVVGRRGGALVEAPPHRGEVWTVAFAPGGGALATVGDGDPLLVRDPDRGTVRARLSEGGATAAGAAWIGDDRLASADLDRTARVWRVADRAVVRRLVHGADLYGLTADPAGAWIATWGDGAIARLWDLERGTPIADLPGHHFGVHAAAAAGSALVTTDEAGQVQVWDLATGDPLGALPNEGTVPLVVARDGAFVTFGDARPRVWRLEPGAPLRRVPGHAARIRDLAFDATGAVVWTASNDDSARGVNLATGRAIVLGSPGHREPPIVDVAAQQPPSPHGLRSLTLAPDGRSLVTAAEDGAIGHWDATTGAAIATWRGHTGRVRKVVFAPDGRTAYSIGDSTLRRWDVAAGSETGRAELGEPGWDVALLGGGAVIATLGDRDQRVMLWNAATLEPAAAPAVPIDLMRALVVVGDRLVVSGAEQLVVLDAAGALTASAVLGKPFTADVSVSARTIAAGNGLGEVALFTWPDLAPIRRWRLGDRVVVALRFRPDGAILASAADRRVQLWDPATGHLLVETPALPALITQLAWRPDGRQLAVAGASGLYWLWDLAPGDASLARFARCVSPWHLVDSALAVAPFEPATCDALGR